jgi:hypothetical protein
MTSSNLQFLKEHFNYQNGETAIEEKKDHPIGWPSARK